MATQLYESHNKKVIQRAQPGDLQEFHRSWYNHWVVYIGIRRYIYINIRRNTRIWDSILISLLLSYHGLYLQPK